MNRRLARLLSCTGWLGAQLNGPPAEISTDHDVVLWVLSNLFDLDVAASASVGRHLSRMVMTLPDGVEPSPNAGIAALSLANELMRLDRATCWLDALSLHGGAWTRQEALVQSVVALHGGYENPLRLLMDLREHYPGHFESVYDRRTARLLVLECLANNPPVGRVLRWAARDLPELDLALDEPIWLGLSGPDRALRFGWGPHRCPGASAAIEMGVAWCQVRTRNDRATSREVH